MTDHLPIVWRPQGPNQRYIPKPAPIRGRAGSTSRVTSMGTNTAKKTGFINKIGRFVRGTFGKSKAFLSNKYVRWGTGIAAAFATGYSILKDGVAKGMRNANEEMANDYLNIYDFTRTNTRYSHLINDIKNATRDDLFDNSFYPKYTKTKNIAASVAGEIWNNKMNIAAVAGATAVPLFFSNPVGIGIGALSAGYLLLNAAGTLLYDVIGFEK